MNRTSLFKNKSSSFLRSFSDKKKRWTGALMLTSLIDAFSILVVYLLMFFSDMAELNYHISGIQLPPAHLVERLDPYLTVLIKKEGYFIEEKKLELEDLTRSLFNFKKKLEASEITYGGQDDKETITIQADKSLSYKDLSPVIQACNQVGFSRMKFMVLGE